MSINRLPEFTFVFVVRLVDVVWKYRFGGERFPTLELHSTSAILCREQFHRDLPSVRDCFGLQLTRTTTNQNRQYKWHILRIRLQFPRLVLPLGTLSNDDDDIQ